MLEAIVFFISILFSGLSCTVLSRKFGLNRKLWLFLHDKVGLKNRSLRIIIWMIVGVAVQMLTERIFEHRGLEEPMLRMPVGIIFGLCIAFIPVLKEEEADYNMSEENGD